MDVYGNSRLQLGVLFAVALVLAPVAAHAGCTLYQHRDFQGASYYLEGGSEMVMTGKERLGVSRSHGGTTYYEPSWNDKLSSFKVSAGCTLTLYQHANKTGSHFISSKSYSYVGSGWNDQASYAGCSCR